MTLRPPGARRVRRALAAACVLVLAAVAGACAEARPDLLSEAESPPTPTPIPTPVPTPTPLPTVTPIPTPTPTPEPPPNAYLTRTNVPVKVVGEVDGGYEVITPCGREATITGEGGIPLRHIDVVLDPGHGGRKFEGGSEWYRNGVYLLEGDLNLDLSRAIAAKLTARGISALLTRTDNYGSILQSRAELADALDADLMISVHHNSPADRTRYTNDAALGMPEWEEGAAPEVFVQKLSPNAEESQRLGKLLADALTAALSTVDINWHSAWGPGAMTVMEYDGEEAYGMLNRPLTPTALVEFGSFSSEAEVRFFKTPEYLELASTAVADAVEEFLAGEQSDSELYSILRPPAGLAPVRGCPDPELE